MRKRQFQPLKRVSIFIGKLHKRNMTESKNYSTVSKLYANQKTILALCSRNDYIVSLAEGAVPDLSLEGREGHRKKGITVRA